MLLSWEKQSEFILITSDKYIHAQWTDMGIAECKQTNKQKAHTQENTKPKPPTHQKNYS